MDDDFSLEKVFIYFNEVNLFQVVKFGHHLMQQINCDIFFIDWERPRVFEHQITLKSTNNLDTPSICSSVSPSIHSLINSTLGIK